MPVFKRASEQLETGVYCWRNKVNGKVYVGSAAVSFKDRRALHLTLLRRGLSPHRHLQNAWNKYGEEMFEWRELWRCPPEDCIDWEQWWIDKTSAADPNYGYNTSPTAGSCLGCKHSEDASAKHAEANRVRAANPEWATKHAEAVKKAHNTPEMRAKKSENMRKAHADPEVGPKMRLATAKMVSDPKVRAKISAAKIKHWTDPEYRSTKTKQGYARTDLTEEKVREIRKTYRKGVRGCGMPALAKKYNVSEGTIYNIINGITWPHVIREEMDNADEQ